MEMTINAGAAPLSARDDIRAAARTLEAEFLGEMLEFMSPPARSITGGGYGEEAFQSFYTQTLADSIAERGGIGLAESIVTAIMKRGAA